MTDLPPPRPPRRLDTVTAEGLDDLVARDNLQRSFVKSRDFPEILEAEGPAPTSVSVVLFDYNSADSFAACWAARQALGESASYHGVNRSTLVEDLDGVATARVVAMLGIAWPLEAMHDLVIECEWLIILASHASVARELEQFPYPRAILVVDPHMGAGALAWNFFRPGVPVPALLRAIEDAELGRKVMREAQAFEDGFTASYKRAPHGELESSDFEEFTSIISDDGGRNAIQKAVARGRELESELQAKSNEAVGRYEVSTLRLFPAWRCALAQVSGDGDLDVTGPVAEALVKAFAASAKVPPVKDVKPDSEDDTLVASKRCFAAAFEKRGQRVRVVLRSLPDGPDVSEIAVAFEGCGHANRAFFMVDADVWDSLWEQPEQVLWDVPAMGPGCIPLRAGEQVVAVRRGERFRESPFDEWSWGYRCADRSEEGWMPTLAHTLFVAVRNHDSPEKGVLALEEGDLLIGKLERGLYKWGWRYRPGRPEEEWESGWFGPPSVYGANLLLPVHAKGAESARARLSISGVMANN